MTEYGIDHFLKSGEKPTDIYQLAGLPRLCQDQNRLVNTFDEPIDCLLDSINYGEDHKRRDTAQHILDQIIEARQIISDEARWQRYDQGLIDCLLDQYRQETLEQHFNEDDFRHWLMEAQNVDTERIDEIVVAWKEAFPEGPSTPPSEGKQFQCKKCGQTVSASFPPLKCKACGSKGTIVGIETGSRPTSGGGRKAPTEGPSPPSSSSKPSQAPPPSRSAPPTSPSATPAKSPSPLDQPRPSLSPPKQTETSTKGDEDSQNTIEFGPDGFPMATPTPPPAPTSSKRQSPPARPHPPPTTVEFGPDGFPSGNYADAPILQSEALPLELSEVTATDRGQFAPTKSIRRDEVDCTVFCFLEVAQGDSMVVQVFTHVPEKAEEAEAKAKKFDQQAEERGFTSLGTEIARGSKLLFKLQMDRAKVQPDTQQLVWRGRTASVQFGVAVPNDTETGTLLGTLVVSQDSVPIGTIVFSTNIVGRTTSSKPKAQVAGVAQRYQKAFISYASQNRNEVLRRIQMLSRVGIETFFDLFSLKAGDTYADKLLEYIDQSDVMFLFWSTAAKKSAWVEKEWRYGLSRKPEGFIEPVIIEGPPAPLPPPELEHLHFNDTVIYFVSESLLTRLWRSVKGLLKKS